MALQIRQSLELPEILQTCVTELRACLHSDRLLIYQFQPDWSGVIVAESVAEGIASVLGHRIDDSCFQKWQGLALQGKAPIIANSIYEMGYEPCHVKLLEQSGVAASLVQSIYVAEKMWGLLIAHHCHGTRQWQSIEAQIVQDLSVQLAIAIQQSNLVAALKAEINERQRLESSLHASQKKLTALGPRQDISNEIALKQEAAQKQSLEDELTVVETVLDDVIGGYWAWDMVTNKEYLSPGFRRMFGYEADANATDITSFQDVLVPEDLPIIQHSLERHIQSRGQTSHRNEVRYRHKNGSIVWVLCAGKVIEWDEQGHPLRMVGGHIDITQQKQNELKLKDSQALIQGITDASPDVLYVFDVIEQRNIYVNRKGSHILGYSAEEIQAMGERFLLTLIHPDDLGNSLKHFERIQRAEPGMIIENEYRVRAKDGSWRWFLSQDVIYKRNAMGQVQQVVGVAQDITQRKLVESQLQRQAQQERVLTQIIERMRSSIELDAVLTTTVKSLQDILQADRVLIYRIFDNGTGAAIAESVLPRWERLLDRVFPEEVFPKQNYERYANGRIFALYDRRAQSKIVLPCLIDFLREIGVQAKLVVPIVQQDKLWGLVIAHQCDGPRNWQDWEINLLRRVANQLAIAIQQADLYQRLQQELAQRESAQEQLSERNEELAMMNQQLARATRLKDEFLANMSHELRTPLNAILGLTEALLEGVFGPLTDKQCSSLETVERSGNHLLSLINDILDVAKIEAGEVVLNCTSLSVKRLCDDSLVFVKQLAHKKNIQVVRQISDNLPNVWGDERRLRQILINLLNNAVKFTPTGGRITLTVRLLVSPLLPHNHEALKGIERVSLVQPMPNLEQSRPSSFVEISITDTGIGIAPENVHKLFKPFIQIDSALNRQYEGTGLGLALVKQLVELHGGEVKVFSRLDIGSTFTVSLPVIPTDSLTATESIANLESAPAPSLATSSSFLILLAEDNEANAMTVMSYFEAKGYRMRHAPNGEAAIALIQQESPDLVLMDIQMPVMDGLTAIRKIRQELGLTELPIVALTALAMEGDEEKCLKAGANYYFSKPIKLKELTLLIQSLLNPES
ncbi:GAF domain-containing protein [Synechocystis sp. LKSZ1]|uniref:GAF domain-containing protein n=1 Tax=Synechocystis sp. LKSZ1 TaxID=3144951 RepID=UPI00336C0016